MIYYQRVKASKDFLEDWSVFEESFWDDKDFIKIHGTEFYLSHDGWSSGETVTIQAKVKENVEVKNFYLPKSFDPGDAYTHEFRSIATQTVYSPQISFKGKAQTSSIRHQIVWTDSCDTSSDWLDVADLKDEDGFTGTFDPNETEPLSDLILEVVLLSGGLRTQFFRANEGKFAKVFIYLPEDQLIRLVDHITSDHFEYISASFTLPEFFLVKPKFNAVLGGYDGQQPYLIPNLTTLEQEMRTSIFLEEYESIDTSSESVGPYDSILEVVDTELAPKINAIYSEIRSLKIAVYVIAIVIIMFALSGISE